MAYKKHRREYAMLINEACKTEKVVKPSTCATAPSTSKSSGPQNQLPSPTVAAKSSESSLLKYKGQKWQQMFNFDKMLNKMRIVEKHHKAKSVAVRAARQSKQVQRLKAADMHYYGVTPKQTPRDLVICNVCRGTYTKIGFNNHMKVQHPTVWSNVPNKVKLPAGAQSAHVSDSSQDGLRDVVPPAEHSVLSSRASAVATTSSHTATASTSQAAAYRRGVKTTTVGGGRARNKSKNIIISTGVQSAAIVEVAKKKSAASAAQALHAAVKEEVLTASSSGSTPEMTPHPLNVYSSSSNSSCSMPPTPKALLASSAETGREVSFSPLRINKDKLYVESVVVSKKKAKSPAFVVKELVETSTSSSASASSSEYERSKPSSSRSTVGKITPGKITVIAAKDLTRRDIQKSELDKAVSSITSGDYDDDDIPLEDSEDVILRRYKMQPKLSACTKKIKIERGYAPQHSSRKTKAPIMSHSNENSMQPLDEMVESKFIIHTLPESQYQYDEPCSTTARTRRTHQHYAHHEPSMKRIRVEEMTGFAHTHSSAQLKHQLKIEPKHQLKVEPKHQLKIEPKHQLKIEPTNEYIEYQQQQQLHEQQLLLQQQQEAQQQLQQQQYEQQQFEQQQFEQQQFEQQQFEQQKFEQQQFEQQKFEQQQFEQQQFEQQQLQQQYAHYDTSFQEDVKVFKTEAPSMDDPYEGHMMHQQHEITTIDAIQLQQLMYQQQNLNPYGDALEQEQMPYDQSTVDLPAEETLHKSHDHLDEYAAHDYVEEHAYDTTLFDQFHHYSVPSLTDDDDLLISPMISNVHAAEQYVLPAANGEQIIYEITANNEVAVMSQQRQQQVFSEFLVQAGYQNVENVHPNDAGLHADDTIEYGEPIEYDATPPIDTISALAYGGGAIPDLKNIKTEHGTPLTPVFNPVKFQEDFSFNTFSYASIPRPLMMNTFDLVKLPLSLATTFSQRLRYERNRYISFDNLDGSDISSMPPAVESHCVDRQSGNYITELPGDTYVGDCEYDTDSNSTTSPPAAVQSVDHDQQWEEAAPETEISFSGSGATTSPPIFSFIRAPMMANPGLSPYGAGASGIESTYALSSPEMASPQRYQNVPFEQSDGAVYFPAAQPITVLYDRTEYVYRSGPFTANHVANVFGVSNLDDGQREDASDDDHTMFRPYAFERSLERRRRLLHHVEQNSPARQQLQRLKQDLLRQRQLRTPSNYYYRRDCTPNTNTDMHVYV